MQHAIGVDPVIDFPQFAFYGTAYNQRVPSPQLPQIKRVLRRRRGFTGFLGTQSKSLQCHREVFTFGQLVCNGQNHLGAYAFRFRACLRYLLLKFLVDCPSLPQYVAIDSEPS